jgi:hypothetical protein
MRKRVLVIGGVLAALVLAIGLWHGHRRARRLGFQFDWPAGLVETYRIDWRSTDRDDVALVGNEAQTFRSDLHLGGELVLRSYGRTGATYSLGLSLRNLSEHQLSFLGKEALGDGRGIEGHEALLEVTPAGEVRAVLVRNDEPEELKSLMQALAGELEVIVPADAEREWTIAQMDSRGKARVHYRADGLTLERSRQAYEKLTGADDAAAAEQSLSSKGTVELEPGWLRALRSADELTVRSKNGSVRLSWSGAFSLELLSTEMKPVPERPVALERRLPGVPVVTSQMQAQMAAQRIGDMTIEQAIDNLLEFGNADHLPGESKWLWQVSGLLKQHPEDCEQLLPVFYDSRSNHNARSLVLDLLASAGSSEAQQVMRTALASDVARGDKRYPAFVQRLGMLEQPTAETVQFLADVYQQQKGQAHVGAAFALGAAAAHADDPSLRQKWASRLAADVQAAPAEDKSLLVRALGNARRAEDEPLFLGLVKDGDARVREAAATALRFDRDAEATRALVSLTSDGADGVEAAALQSLNDRPLEEEQVQSMTTGVRDGKVKAGVDGQLVAIAERQLSQPSSVELLHAVLDRSTDSTLKARIRALVGQQAASW